MTREHKRRPGSLSVSEREEIRVGIEVGESDQSIASRLGRHRSTVWREIAASGGRGRDRAAAAEERAARVARRPKSPWTEERPWLWEEVQGLLRTKKWSPEQIAHRFRKEHPDQPEWWGVSRGHLPGGLRPGEGRAAQGAHRALALGPGSETSSLSSLLWTCVNPRDGQHLRTPRRGR